MRQFGRDLKINIDNKLRRKLDLEGVKIKVRAVDWRSQVKKQIELNGIWNKDAFGRE